MTTSAEQIRSYDGPAIFSYGFRPFFLFGAAWAAVAVALWLPMLGGRFTLPTALAPVAWHVHELVHVPAVVADGPASGPRTSPWSRSCTWPMRSCRLALGFSRLASSRRGSSRRRARCTAGRPEGQVVAVDR